MNSYKVVYMARKRGSIGAPYRKEITCKASCVAEAIQVSFEMLQRSGLETFHCVSVDRQDS